MSAVYKTTISNSCCLLLLFLDLFLAFTLLLSHMTSGVFSPQDSACGPRYSSLQYREFSRRKSVKFCYWCSKFSDRCSTRGMTETAFIWLFRSLSACLVYHRGVYPVNITKPLRGEASWKQLLPGQIVVSRKSTSIPWKRPLNSSQTSRYVSSSTQTPKLTGLQK